MIPTATLLFYCDDKPGILANITEYINRHNGNIIHLDQHVDSEEKLFYIRIEWEIDQFTIPRDNIENQLNALFSKQDDSLVFDLFFSDIVPRMAIFVSKMSHCLYDLLARYEADEWAVEIPLIISNHEDIASVAKKFGIPYYQFPITKETKVEQEAKQKALLDQYNIDFIVLARYMQVISEDFVNHYPNKIINIHHSFLPAFMGAKPYHAAHKRGVKIIGATGHYVTSDLDAGPIIEQDVARISHLNSVK
jgi:formyltetrahydrofolate deformylase